MQSINRRYDPILLATLNLLGVASLMGFLYCLIVLLHGSYVFETTAIMLYMLWFAICGLSVSIMKKGDISGAYALGIATIGITIYEFMNGLATIGGAISGTLVILIIINYIKMTINNDSQQETRLTN